MRGVKCSYFIHICDRAEDEAAARARLIDYFTLSGLRSTKTMGDIAPAFEGTHNSNGP